MKIRLYPPFHERAGDVVELHLEREMPLHEFLDLFVKNFPRLVDFLPPEKRKSADLLSNVFFITSRENPAKVLNPSDIVREEDFLQILPLFDGG